MFKQILFAAMLLVCSAAQAQMSTTPQVDKEETIRRGDMVQEIGTTQEGPFDLIADALAPPEDDSHKWYITLVTMPDCKPCEALKADFMRSDPLRAWANPQELEESWSHYQVRRFEDADEANGAQRDWFKGVKDKIAEGFKVTGGPCIVIQPPRNGEFGPNKTVVAMLFGYDGDGDKTAKKIRAAIVNYVEVMKRRGMVTHVGPNRSGKTLEGGARQMVIDKEEPPTMPRQIEGGAKQQIAAPPFTIPAKPMDLTLPNGPIDIPQPKPQAVPLSLAQLQMIVPNAPADFYLAVLNAGVDNVQMVQLLYAQYQSIHGPVAPSVPTPEVVPAHPTTPSVRVIDIISLLLGGGSFLALVPMGLMIWRKVNKNHIFNDQQFANLIAMLQQLGGNPPTP